MRKHYLVSFFCLFILFAQPSQAQLIYRQLDVPVYEGGNSLENPWIGGFNNVLMSPIFLNSDTIPDLFVYDRKGDKILTFINNGTPNEVDYTYDPSYERMFPDIKAWALIVDYNNDGVSDIYAHVNTGVQVYKGSRNGENISFTLASPLLEYDSPFGKVNIWVSIDDLPAVVDVDEDGDLDVLAFGLAENTVTYYKNVAVDSGWSLDSLKYAYVTNCWGGFAEGGLTNDIFLGACKNGDAPAGSPDPGSVRHAGSTVTAFDQDGDGDKELLLGDISYDNLVYLLNGGDTSFAQMIWYDSVFPVYNRQAAITVYPAASIIDLNNDGQEDMVSSPFVTAGTENYASIQMYLDENMGDSVFFDHVTDSFMVTDAMDFGEGAVIDIAELSGDTLLDFVVGNYGYFDQGGYTSSLAYYRQIVDSGRIAFELVTRDLQSFSLLGLNAMHPGFGDIDSDGDMDMILGEEEGFIHLLYNIANPGDPANFRLDSIRMASIDVGQFSAPHLYDLDQDGDLDLLIGRKEGRISYYWNLGDANTPLFNKDSVNTFLGEIVSEANFFSGRSKPYVGRMDSTDNEYLFVGSNTGKVLVYEIDQDSLLSGSFNELYSAFGGLDEGGKTAIAIDDINRDTIPDFILSNDRGGLSLYSAGVWDTNSIVQPPDTPNNINYVQLNSSWEVFPNPGSSTINIRMDLPEGLQISSIRMVDILGRVVKEEVVSNSYLEKINVADLSNGVYLIELHSDDLSLIKRFIKQ